MNEKEIKQWNEMMHTLRTAFPNGANPAGHFYADDRQYEAQRIMQNTLEILTLNGFLASGTCRCDGYYTHKFRKGLYEVRWRKSKYLFRIRYKNDSVTEWLNISHLEKTLNELVAKNNQA